jgi:hypothetical protein
MCRYTRSRSGDYNSGKLHLNYLRQTVDLWPEIAVAHVDSVWAKMGDTVAEVAREICGEYTNLVSDVM